MIHEIKIFDAIDKGLNELYCMFKQTSSSNARNQLLDIINLLETEDVYKAKLLIWTNEDGTVSPIVIGGNSAQQEKLITDFKVTIKKCTKQFLH